MIFYICFIISIFILDLILGNYIREEETDNSALLQLVKSLFVFTLITVLAYFFIKSDFLYSILQEKYPLEKANNIRLMFYVLYLILYTLNLYSLFEVSIDSYTTYLVKNNSPKKYLVIISTFIAVVLAQVFLLSDTTRYSNVLGTNNWFFFIIMFIITIIYPVLVGIKIYRYVTRHDYIVKETNRKSNNDDEDEVIARKVEIIETPVKKEKEHEKDYYEDEFLNDFDDDNF
jgi:membrane protein